MTQTFNLIESYLDLLRYPKRPGYKSEEQRKKLEPTINERLRRDDEYVENLYSKRFLAGSIIQFAFAGIERFSSPKKIPDNYKTIPKIKNAAKFIIGREIDEIHIGLIIYIGRNQWAHHWDKELREPNISLFNKLANWYSPTYKKYFVNSFYDLTNESVEIFASNLLYLLGWQKFEDFEKDMSEMLKDFSTTSKT